MLPDCIVNILSQTLLLKQTILSHPFPLQSNKFLLIIEAVSEKTNNLGSDQVRHKPGCTVTEDG